MGNPFILDKDDYKRHYDILKSYENDMTLYLQLHENMSEKDARDFVRFKMREYMRDPEIVYLTKETPANRELARGTFLQYLKDAINKHRIIAPTLTVYLSFLEKASILGKYIIRNMNLRKSDKKKMFSYGQLGDYVMEAFYNIMQSIRKIKNNALSGAHGTQGTILGLANGHPGLTSTCRSGSSYGNANNERFLRGNRHLWCPDIVEAQILWIVNNTDYEKMHEAIKAYDIHYPTVDETMECILYSSRLYWKSKEDEDRIYALLTKLKPIERAAFVYTGDMYHLAKHNDKLVREFYTKLIELVDIPAENYDEILNSAEGDMLALACIMCTEVTKGHEFSKLRKEDPRAAGLVAATIEKNKAVIESYRVLIRGLWVTKHIPGSIARLPSIIRRCVILSDTDSTVFTTAWWVEWYRGKIDFSLVSERVANVTTYLTSQMVIHLMAMVSANMGVVKHDIHRLTMKNEYFFPIFIQTSMAKHYAAWKAIREGNVFAKYKLELKGKNLRDSTLPEYIVEMVEDYVKDLMNAVIERGYLELREIFDPIANLELNILENIANGHYEDMPTVGIKEETAYSEDAANNFFYHRLWQGAFAQKYGDVDYPPYKGVKLSVNLGTPTAMKAWLAGMEDKQLAQRIQTELNREGRRHLELIVVPEAILEANGIPPEILQVINSRKLVAESTMGFYIILEALGLYISDDKHTKLVSDHYRPYVRTPNPPPEDLAKAA